MAASLDRRLRLVVWSAAGVRLGDVRRPLSVSFTPRWNASSSLTFTVAADDRRLTDLLQPGCRVVVDYLPDGDVPLPEVSRSGTVEQVTGQPGELEVTVRDDWSDVMQAIVGWPVPAAGLASQVDRDYAVTGPAETVALDIIGANVTRLGLDVTVPASAGRGDSITVAIRMVPLADRLLPAIDTAGIGVSVVQVGGQRTVQVRARGSVATLLTEASGAVGAGSWGLTAPTVTRVVLGGGGEGTARVFRSKVDSALEAGWGVRRERFVDARDLDPGDATFEADAVARMDEALAEGAPQSSVAAPLAETPRFHFGRQYTLGDQVAVQLEGAPAITDVVREVDIEWTVEDGLTVTPKVGLWDDSPETALYRTVARIAREQREGRAV